jgi:spermidine/putrescine transport system permease protein
VRARRVARRWYAVRLGPLVAFLAVFFVTPFVILFLYSFGRSSIVSLSFGANGENWSSVLTDEFYRRLLVRSVVIGVIVGLVSVVLAFPFAYAITIGPLRRRAESLLFAVLITLFSAYVVRIYAWRTLLGRNGIINEAFDAVGLGPYDFLLFNQPAVALTLVNVLIPMAVLPMYSALAQVDPALIEAARDAGAGSIRTLTSVTIPLASRGINAAFALCFLIAAGDYVTPQFVGGIDGQMLGNVIAEQFGTAFNWPLGSALAFLLVGVMASVIGAWLLLMRLFGFRMLR